MKNSTSTLATEKNLSKEELIAKLTAQAQPTQAPVCMPQCIG